MKNKKGFTLIELLTIIIILGIIAVITVPRILNIIDESKKGTLVDSTYGYVNAVERHFVANSLDDSGSELPTGTFSISELENTISISGKKPTDGWVMLENGTVIDYSLQFDEYAVNYDKVKNIAVAEKGELALAASTIEGKELNTKMKRLAGDADADYNTENTTITAFKHSETKPDIDSMTSDNIITQEGSKYPLYIWFDNGTIYWWSEDNNPSLNSNLLALFAYCINLTDVSGLKDFNTSKVTNMKGIFYECNNLSDISALSNWNTSNVTNMSAMFYKCSNLSDISALSNWNTSNVTNMQSLFNQCNSITDISALSNWNTSKVTNMGTMFQNVLMTSLEPLRKWDTSKVTDMSYMFGGAKEKQFTTLEPLKNWNVSNVIYMNTMFSNVKRITTLEGLENWNVSNVETMGGMFQTATSLTNISAISNWNISKVNNFGFPEGASEAAQTKKIGMFSGCTSLTNSSPINNWNINPSADFKNMFYNTPSHPEFTKVSGTWDSEGTFTPAN